MIRATLTALLICVALMGIAHAAQRWFPGYGVLAGWFAGCTYCYLIKGLRK